MKILHVLGARPNFMKAAPVIAAIGKKPKISQVVVHTGQHYDKNMSDVFFSQLGIPDPDVNLQVGSGSHAKQTSEIMARFEPVVEEHRPDWVVVYGDVNSTIATALVSSKLGIKIAHVEAGLRSRDRSMPEEINRILTDQLADLLLTPSTDGDENLLNEGVPKSKIRFVGNVMIDTLVRMLPEVEKHRPPDLPAKYALVTMHRPANVDNLDWLKRLLHILKDVSKEMPVIFPVHPRTQTKIQQLDATFQDNAAIRLVPPAPYVEFLALQKNASIVITDSGGIQEETTFLGVPCLTLRDNTERPVTVTMGTNVLVGTDLAKLKPAIDKALASKRTPSIPPLWDGKAAERIADIFAAGI